MNKLVIILLFIISINKAHSQVCTPDPNATGWLSPVQPDSTTDFGQYYEQTFTITVITDTILFPSSHIFIDSLVLDSMSGLPNGLTSQCNINCSYLGGTEGCFTISGTVNAIDGVYPVAYNVTLYGSMDSIGGNDLIIPYANVHWYNLYVGDSTIIIPPTCTAEFILYPDSTLEHTWYLLANGSGEEPITYVWEWGDGTTSTEANPSHTYSIPGYYNICMTITDANNCTSTFCDSSTYIFKTDAEMISVSVINQINVGIEEEGETKNLFTLYPNPATTTLTIESTVNSPQTTVAIHNAQGQLVSHPLSRGECASLSAGKGCVLDISSFTPGIYFLTLSNGEQTLSRKFVKE